MKWNKSVWFREPSSQVMELMKVKVTQSCPTLWDSMDYTVHVIIQARILEWVAFPFSKGPSQSGHQTQASRIAGRFFTKWAIRWVITNLGSVLKSRDISVMTKFCIVKAMVFPVVMYGCESWTIKRAEPWGTDAFELCCWRRPLSVCCIARRSN